MAVMESIGWIDGMLSSPQYLARLRPSFAVRKATAIATAATARQPSRTVMTTAPTAPISPLLPHELSAPTSPPANSHSRRPTSSSPDNRRRRRMSVTATLDRKSVV